MVRTQAVVLVVAVLICGCSRNPRITVGSKNFTEQVLLGEMMAQHIENKLGIVVERKLNLGGTLLAHEALKSGSIDLYPEYTGTALTAVLKQPVISGAEAVLERVRGVYLKSWSLRWLAPLGFENTFAMVVRKDAGVQTLSQTANSTKRWRLGAGYEFLKRPDGLEGLLRTYPLRLEGAPVAMDLGLLYSAIQSGKVDMAAANSTDGLLSVLPVIALQDDRSYFPPYQCAFIVRETALAEHEGLRAAMEELSGKLDAVTMRKLNHAIDGEHRSVKDVAREALKTIGLAR